MTFIDAQTTHNIYTMMPLWQTHQRVKFVFFSKRFHDSSSLIFLYAIHIFTCSSVFFIFELQKSQFKALWNHAEMWTWTVQPLYPIYLPFDLEILSSLWSWHFSLKIGQSLICVLFLFKIAFYILFYLFFHIAAIIQGDSSTIVCRKF